MRKRRAEAINNLTFDTATAQYQWGLDDEGGPELRDAAEPDRPNGRGAALLQQQDITDYTFMALFHAAQQGPARCLPGILPGWGCQSR